MLNLFTKQLNAAPANQNSSESTVVEKPVEPKGVDYSLLEEAFGKTDEKTEPVTPVTETPEQIATALETERTSYLEQVKDLSVDERTKIDATKTPEQLAAYNKVAEPITSTEPVLKLSGDVELGKDVDFITTGKELGMEVKENNLEALKNAYNEALEAKTKESWSNNIVKELEKEPEVLEAYLLKKQGQSVKAIDDALTNLDYHLNLSNIDLAKAELLTSLSEEAAEIQLEKLTEEGRVDVFANQIRETLNKSKTETVTKRTEFFNDLKTKEQAREVNEKKLFTTSLEKEFKDVNQFAGIKIDQRVPVGILRNFEQGKYDFKDPKFVAKAIMAFELAEDAVKTTKNQVVSEAMKKEMQSLTNVPTKTDAKNVIATQHAESNYHKSIEENFKK